MSKVNLNMNTKVQLQNDTFAGKRAAGIMKFGDGQLEADIDDRVTLAQNFGRCIQNLV